MNNLYFYCAQAVHPTGEGSTLSGVVGGEEITSAEVASEILMRIQTKLAKQFGFRKVDICITAFNRIGYEQ